MRRYFGSLALMFSAVLLLVSCLSTDNDTTSLDDDTAITSFSLTNARMTVHTTSSKGNDSTYVITSTDVANYTFQIDQLKGEIYNLDSLPVGVDARKILCSYSTKNSGLAYIQSLEKADSLPYLQTTDTIDFSHPRKIKVVSTSGKFNREYTVRVNVHQEDPDSFRWQRLADFTSVADAQGMKMVAFAGKMLLFVGKGSATMLYATDGKGDCRWTAVAADQEFGGTLYTNVVVKNDSLFVLDVGENDSRLFVSVDGQHFELVDEHSAVRQLVGGCTTELYALSKAGSMMVSYDGGRSWTADDMDDADSYLPSRDIMAHCTSFAYSPNTDKVLLTGNRSVDDYAADSTAVVWRKIVEYSTYSRDTEWNYIKYDRANSKPLPRLDHLVVLPYANHWIAFGGKGVGACTKEAYSQIYYSDDDGLTWSADARFAFPSGFDKTAETTAAVDADHFVWMVTSAGQVWKGRLNELGWKK